MLQPVPSATARHPRAGALRVSWWPVLACWLWCVGAAAQPAPAPDAGSAPIPPPSAAAAPADPSAAGAPVAATAADAGQVGDAGAELAPFPPALPVAPEGESGAASTPEPNGVQLRGSKAKVLGTLRGSVLSADDESPLDGASIYVRNTDVQAQADASGAFTLSLGAGNYQISAIHPGFATQNISNVEIKAGQTSTLNIKLRAGSQELDEMVVVGSRVKGGIATLIAERREAKAVADVIGAEQMARSGDSNAAAALSRVTGITVVDGRFVLVRGMGQRYSTLTLNGFQVASPDPTRRVVPLDLFPAGLIDSVVVQKTYTPDLPGEFGGGLVQLRSRDYPHEFLLSANLALGGNFKSLFQQRVADHGGSLDGLGIDDGRRELPSSFEDSRGKIVLGNISNPDGYTEEEITQLGKELPRDRNTQHQLTPPDVTAGLNIGNEWRLRHAKIGFVTGAGYRVENRNFDDAYVEDNPGVEASYRFEQYKSQVSLSGFLDWGVTFSPTQKLKFTTMLLRQTDDVTQRRTYDNPGEDVRTYLQWVERQVFLQQVSGKHTIEKLNRLQADWRYGYGRASRLEPNRRFYGYSLNEDGVYAFQPGGTTNASVFGDMDDATHEAGLDLAEPFPLWRRLEGKLKAGGMFYRRDRNSKQRTFEYVVSSEVERTGPPDTVINDDTIGNGATFAEITRPTDTYDAWMQLEAGYLSLELPVLKALEIDGGARLEHARLEATTFDPFSDMSPPIVSKLDNLDVLPSASLTWRFLESFQARAGYSRTVNRPDLRELSPGRYNDLESNLTLVGNPEVKRALIDNFDARFEWYYTSDEVFSIGGFLKLFDDPIEDVIERGQDIVRSIQNNENGAISYGLELDGRKRFGFIADALNRLYLASNFTLIDSKVEIPKQNGDGVFTRPLQGQSPWVINVQLGWDDSEGSGTTASLLFNSAGKRIRFVGDPNQMIPDTYELPIHRLDFVISQKLPKKFNLGARVRNILNAKEVWEENGVVVRRIRRGADFQVSCSWSY